MIAPFGDSNAIKSWWWWPQFFGHGNGTSCNIHSTLHVISAHDLLLRHVSLAEHSNVGPASTWKPTRTFTLFSYFVLYQACYVGDYKWSLMSQYVHPTFDNTKLLHSCRTACPLIRSSLAESFVWSKQWFCESRGPHCGNVKDAYIYSVCLSNEVRRKQNNQW